MCSPDHGFYLLDRQLAHPTPKVCTIITLVACTFRKRIWSPTHTRNCAIRLVIFISLRFCNVFKTDCKTLSKNNIVVPKRYTLHAVTTHKCFFKNMLGKRFWLEHLCKVCAQHALWLSFTKVHAPRSFLHPSPPLVEYVSFFYTVLMVADREVVQNPRWLQLAGKENVRTALW